MCTVSLFPLVPILLAPTEGKEGLFAVYHISNPQPNIELVELANKFLECHSRTFLGKPLFGIPLPYLEKQSQWTTYVDLHISASSSMWLNGSGYVLYDVGTHQPGRSTVSNNIAFRFATTNPWGVVMLTDIADDHVIVELVNGFLRVSWDLGQGREIK